MTSDNPLLYGSLFSGIGGMDLGFDRAGMKCAWQVEIDPYARRVLDKHWPEVPKHDDIRTFTNIPYVDVVAGGFPCQDISYAGKGAGLAGERSGLFYEAIRVVREVGPRFVVLENVAALLTRGIGDVLGTLASLGFDAEWHCIPAAALGAPHIRDRVFILGYSDRSRGTTRRPARERARHGLSVGAAGSHAPSMADTESAGWQPCGRNRHANSASANCGRASQSGRTCIGSNSNSDGRSEVECENRSPAAQARFVGPLVQQGPGRRETDWWESEPNVGRVANGVPKRVDRLRGLGNAVVPQVAEWIARRIVQSV